MRSKPRDPPARIPPCPNCGRPVEDPGSHADGCERGYAFVEVRDE